jgi:2-isopropylmalate synthase
MTVEVGGAVYAGRARARDILPCCVSAYIDAVSNAQAIQAIGAAQFEQEQAA